MEFKLHRRFLGDTYTIGDLYIDEVFFCNVLEDTVRDRNKDGDLKDTGETKVYGQTAIPYGKYKIVITYSQRFKRKLPLLVNVPEFEGIRIHPGNKQVDTHGCLLVGINDVKGEIHQSKIYFEKLLQMMENSKQTEWYITIV